MSHIRATGPFSSFDQDRSCTELGLFLRLSPPGIDCFVDSVSRSSTLPRPKSVKKKKRDFVPIARFNIGYNSNYKDGDFRERD